MFFALTCYDTSLLQAETGLKGQTRPWIAGPNIAYSTLICWESAIRYLPMDNVLAVRAAGIDASGVRKSILYMERGKR
jgi:hypothetical protein